MSAPYYSDDRVTLWHGDCREVLRLMPDASIDSVVTDPPYELGFMGKGWDASGVAYDAAMWAECLRVLKPGGHLLAFGGSRTWHRLACAVEDAGFELRDSIAWLYGSGFPKSLNVSKAIDKVRSEDRAPVDAVRSWLNARRIDAGFSHDAVNKHFGHASNGGGSSSSWMTNPTLKALPTWDQWLDLKALFGFGDDMDDEVRRLNGRKGKPGANFEAREVLSERVSEVKGGSWADNVATGRFQIGEKIIRETAPATDDALTWQGWGTALKPAFEPIVVARKPLTGTVAANVTTHGTGALNIDGCRIGTTETLGRAKGGWGDAAVGATNYGNFNSVGVTVEGGRWPANVVLDETQAAALDEQSGDRPGDNPNRKPRQNTAEAHNRTVSMGRATEDWTTTGHADVGAASRFFYVAKAPKGERPVAFRPSCNCETMKPWTGQSQPRDTAGSESAGDRSWNTSTSGSSTTDATSPRGTTSTTETATSSTTTSGTSNSSRSSSTSESTPVANSETASGGSPAPSAANSSPSTSSTGTSARKAGPSTADAGHATSGEWSETSACGRCGAPAKREAHPTVKPLSLMRWLVRLVTPPGGTVLEPFAGSGTTAEACIIEGFRCVTIEQEATYLPLIEQRINKPLGLVLDFSGEAS